MIVLSSKIVKLPSTLEETKNLFDLKGAEDLATKLSELMAIRLTIVGYHIYSNYSLDCVLNFSNLKIKHTCI
jgi:hypothetical protein